MPGLDELAPAPPTAPALTPSVADPQATPGGETTFAPGTAPPSTPGAMMLRLGVQQWQHGLVPRRADRGGAFLGAPAVGAACSR